MPKSRVARAGAASALVIARARKIRLLIMDVDGVMTDGHVNLIGLPDGSTAEMKSFSSQDGAGLKMARDAGIRTGIITGRDSPAVTRRARETGIEFVFQGRAEKIPAYEEIIRAAGVEDSEVAYVGDDLPDLPILRRVGLAVAVANAVIEVKRAAHLVTKSPGGAGGVRETIEIILKAHGKWQVVAKRAKA